MNYKKIIIQAGKQMLKENLTVQTWGNISLKDPKSKKIYITPSGMSYASIQEDDICVLDLSGKQIAGKRKPSVELLMHVQIYQARPDVLAILHTHPLCSSVFGVLHQSIPVINDELAQANGGSVDVTNYALPGTATLASNVVKALGNKKACLIANHGAVCVGNDISQCFKVSTVLETTAQIYQMSLAVGKPTTISNKDVEYMYDFAQNHYGQRK